MKTMIPILKISIVFGLLFFISLPFLSAQESAPAPANVAETGTVIREDWLIAILQGKRCGYGSLIVRERSTPAGKQFITDSNQEFKFQRQGQVLHIISRSSVVETVEGVVVSFQTETHGGGSDQVTRGYRVGDELVLVNGAQQQRIPLARTVLGPEAFERKSRALKLESGATFSAESFIADFPQTPILMTVKVVGPEKIPVRNEPRTLWKMTMTMSLLPGMETVLYVDDSNRTQLVLMPFPGLGQMQLLSTTRTEAMKELESLEVFACSLITPKQPLTNVGALKSATMRLTTPNSRALLTLASGPEQTILESLPGQATVRITVPTFDEKTPTWQLPHAPNAELKPFLTASPYVEKTPRLEELAQQAVGDEKNPFLAARKIQNFARSYIQRKDLSVGFATAEETAASRTGDCTEHAVLCAALGRAVGLPTRLVVGFGYLPTNYDSKQTTGSFGFHMWAEAWLGPNQWQPMDAALGKFDVGHIAIAKTALQEVNPLAELTMPILNLMQNLQIDIIETR